MKDELKKLKNKLDITKINEVLGLSSKILKLVYILMIVGIAYVAVLFIKELGIIGFLLTILKIATPFFIGFVIAWFFNPMVVTLENRGWKRGVACATVYLVLIACIALFFGTLIPTIYHQLNDLIVSVPSILSSVQEWVTNVLNGFSSNDLVDIASIKTNLFSSLETMVTNITTNLPSAIMNIMASLTSGVATIAVGFVVGLYLLLDYDDVCAYFLKFVPKKNQEEISHLLSDIGHEVRRTVHGTLLIACMVFVCDSIGFAIAGLKAPLLLGLLCGITDLIPYIGPYIGGAAAVVVGFSQDPVIGIAVLIIAVVVQLVENYILQPVVMSKAMQIHPVAIIIGLLLFGHFFGIIGMIVATPIISLLKVVAKYVSKKYHWFNSDVFE